MSRGKYWKSTQRCINGQNIAGMEFRNEKKGDIINLICLFGAECEEVKRKKEIKIWGTRQSNFQKEPDSL